MTDQIFHQFNRGKIDRLSLGRIDQKRVSISAETMTNWMPRVLGPMSLRPGMEYLASTYSNNYAQYLPFIFDLDDTALIELTDSALRVIVDDTPVTRPSVSAAVTDGTFVSDATTNAAWTDSDEAGATSAWTTGYLGLTGNGTAFAIRDQSVVLFQSGVEHALRVEVARGPVVFRVGSTQGDDDYVSETKLGTGSHSLSFTPTTNFWIQFKSNLKRLVLVESCEVESAGVMVLDSPWSEADLPSVRCDQSGDILYCASGLQQYKIERRSETSWSIVKYEPEDGPFRTENVSTVTLTPAALTGNTSLTASKPTFKSTNVGGLYRVTSDGQEVTVNVTAENSFTDPIRVTGITGDRLFQIYLAGTVWAGASTITLQRSLTSESGPWSDVATKSWTADTTETYDDGLDNQIVWYRIGCKTGDYVGADDIDCTLDYPSGSIVGVCRVTSYFSETLVYVEVIEDFGGTTASDIWAEGSWSDRRGFPSAVAFHDGRLWWSGKDSIIGSISDNFEGFDPDFEGDAGPINRTLGKGPVDDISWILSLQRMVVGAKMAEFSIRSSSFDSPLTPTDFTIRRASTQGSRSVQAVEVDQDGVFVQRSGYRVYRLTFNGQTIDYGAQDLTILVPEMGSPGIVRMAVQRKPDTRIHCIRSDGTAMIGIMNFDEEVLAWVDIETDGEIEDVVILPEVGEDAVYYSVKRTINGGTVRYLEKWAQEVNCRGGTVNYLADSYYEYSGAATTTITGLSHLEGESVTVWADGDDVGTNDDYSQAYTVVGGQITLAASASNVIVGLPYTAQFKSSRIGSQYAFNDKRVDRLGLYLAWVHPKGLRYGPDFTNLDDMPEIEEGVEIDANTLRDEYAEDPVMFPGLWDSNARLCLQAQAPRSVTVLAAIPDMSISR